METDRTMQATTRLLPSRAVCDRYSISDRTLDRWLDDERINFPQPKVIRKRRYWLENALDAFDHASATV